MTDIRTLVHHPAALTVWLPLLVGLQGVPHTGALRTLFLLIGIGHLIWLWRLRQTPLPKLAGGVEQPVFWLLTIWLTLQSAFIALEPSYSLKALASDWGKLILMALLGVWLARIVSDRRWIVLGLFSAAFLHVLSTLGFQAVSLVKGNGLAYQQSFLCEYPVASSFTTAAFIWLMADGISRLWHRRALFPWPASISVILAFLALIAEARLGAKSGQVVIVTVIVVMGLLLLTRVKLNRRWSIGLSMAIITAVGLIIAGEGNRWSGIGESLHAAWQEPTPLQALVTDNTPIPAGTNHSFYMRAIRGKVGMDGIVEHPWGLGFGADVYHRYVLKRYGIPDAINSSNSGLIDFGLANGVAGLSLLLILAGALIRRGWSAFVKGRPEAIVLALLVFQHIGRYALDGTLAGSRFSGIALVFGVLWAISVMEQGNRALPRKDGFTQ